ncbi:hypothetical protein IMG5_122850 [Ichthyophthirius multifiliis]|uniref:Rieske domain-containing protein n=1 Tax=Ichthyophthirius multifiliis TaxID=5932 RepID=G0QVC5_ICHMU|nr:hypothetical protein IMG5_122850 [Ichthyophthirius multifiliis]EGR30814.1 hypothetical protein IMG5_122850 [Ichthyophthirius multifiliis]|eukprot:XP_004032401.1 hypothetical protein IMG5_122850 [Ichthyophthirius multifiliis]
MFSFVFPANLKEGEKIEVQLDPEDPDSTVLVCKVDETYFCVSNKCPIFGAPLSKGHLFKDKIVCPQHNTQFSVKSGYVEGGPVFDGLQRFQITEKDGKLRIKVPKNKLNIPKNMKMVKYDINNKQKYVIIGGGPAGLSAAETLRQCGFSGKIIIVNKEKYLAYDRTVLSKNVFFSRIKDLQFRQKDFLDNYGIEILNEEEVVEINSERKFVETKNKNHIHFDKLLISSGSEPVVFECFQELFQQNKEINNLVTLREYQDVVKIRKQILVQNEKNKKPKIQQKKNILIVGASFNGMESASSIKEFLKENANITIIDINQQPYERLLGKEVGNAIKENFKQNGVNFLMNCTIKDFKEEDNKIQTVTLSTGEVLKPDLVLLGTGTLPNTKFVGQEVEKDEFGAIKTDSFLQSSNESIYAAGDVACYPYHFTGERIRSEHINSSVYQGYIAALNMYGKLTPVQQIPFFWTGFFGKQLHYTGFVKNYDEVYIQGDLKKLEFLAWYLKNDKVLAVASVNQGPVGILINEAMRLNLLPSAMDIKKGRVNLDDIQKKVNEAARQCKCKRQSKCKI